MSFDFITSSQFEKDLKELYKKYPSIKNDIYRLKNELLVNPAIGTPIGKDCYKIRFSISSKGKGKRGGGRLISCIKIVKETIFLITVYDKSAKEDVTEKALAIILKELGL